MSDNVDVDMMSSDSSSPQTSYINSVFSRPPIYNNIFSNLSPESIIRFGKTSTVVYHAASDFCSLAYNINNHLSRFFDKPIAFRSLQARTATVISGSNALQFLDRTFYPESDLDLYVHPGDNDRQIGQWLIDEEGYQFMPNSLQPKDFNMACKLKLNREIQDHVQNDVDKFHAQHCTYRIWGILAIYTFVRSPGTKIQIITTENTPLQSILSFHSTCVMNFITASTAYSLYPRATFGERCAVSLAGLKAADGLALSKYALRGWGVISSIWPHEIHTTRTAFHLNETRWVNDKYSWVLPLDMKGVEPRPRLSAPSVDFSWDPELHMSWQLAMSTVLPEATVDDPYPLLGKIVTRYKLLNPTIFRYVYLVADDDLVKTLIEFAKEQGRLEHLKVRALSAKDREKVWTWWDASLPGFIDAHLNDSLDKTESE